jgi:hypothetical protein
MLADRIRHTSLFGDHFMCPLSLESEFGGSEVRRISTSYPQDARAGPDSAVPSFHGKRSEQEAHCKDEQAQALTERKEAEKAGEEERQVEQHVPSAAGWPRAYESLTEAE